MIERKVSSISKIRRGKVVINLREERRFIVKDDEDNVLIVKQIQIDDIVQNIIWYKGSLFKTDYSKCTMDYLGEFEMQISTNIDGIHKID